MSWKNIKNELPPVNTWVVGKRGIHRPFIFRLIHEKGTFTVAGACLDVDNNYREPDRWVAIPDD